MISFKGRTFFFMNQIVKFSVGAGGQGRYQLRRNFALCVLFATLLQLRFSPSMVDQIFSIERNSAIITILAHLF